MAPISSWRRLPQAGTDLESLNVERALEFEVLSRPMFRRDSGSDGDSHVMTPAESAAVLVAIVLVVVVVLGGIALLLRRNMRRRSSLSPVSTSSTPTSGKRMSVGSAGKTTPMMTEKRQAKIQTLPKIQIIPPEKSDLEIAVESTVEIVPPPQVRIQTPPRARIQGRPPMLNLGNPHAAQPFFLPQPASPTHLSPSTDSPSSAASPVGVSLASSLPSFYSVSGDQASAPRPRPGKKGRYDPFSDPDRDSSDDSDDLPLSPVQL